MNQKNKHTHGVAKIECHTVGTKDFFGFINLSILNTTNNTTFSRFTEGPLKIGLLNLLVKCSGLDDMVGIHTQNVNDVHLLALFTHYILRRRIFLVSYCAMYNHIIAGLGKHHYNYMCREFLLFRYICLQTTRKIFICSLLRPT